MNRRGKTIKHSTDVFRLDAVGKRQQVETEIKIIVAMAQTVRTAMQY